MTCNDECVYRFDKSMRTIDADTIEYTLSGSFVGTSLVLIDTLEPGMSFVQPIGPFANTVVNVSGNVLTLSLANPSAQ
jgi:hypothetical protein